MKTAKRLLRENTNPDGSLDNDKVACAVLQYHNTPLQYGGMSPSQLLFGRNLPDFLPVNPKLYKLHPYWAEKTHQAQAARSSRLKETVSRYNFGTRKLPPLRVGVTVVVQNHATKRWDRYGKIIQVLPHRKYQLRMEDTGNIMVRNRRFLKPKKERNNVVALRRFSGPSASNSGLPIVTAPHAPATFHPGRVDVDHPTEQLPTSNQSTCQQADTATPRTHTNEPVSEQVHTRPLPVREALALRRLRPHNSLGLTET